MSEVTKINNAKLRFLTGFARHLLNRTEKEAPNNQVFADELFTSIVTVSNRIKELENDGLLHVDRWTVDGPGRYRRTITVTADGVKVLLNQNPDFMRKMGFRKNGERRANK